MPLVDGRMEGECWRRHRRRLVLGGKFTTEREEFRCTLAIGALTHRIAQLVPTTLKELRPSSVGSPGW